MFYNTVLCCQEANRLFLSNFLYETELLCQLDAMRPSRPQTSPTALALIYEPATIIMQRCNAGASAICKGTVTKFNLWDVRKCAFLVIINQELQLSLQKFIDYLSRATFVIPERLCTFWLGSEKLSKKLKGDNIRMDRVQVSYRLLQHMRLP